MERFTYGAITVGIIIFGICMVIWPTRIAKMNRDAGDTAPPTRGQVWQVRIVGAFLAGMGAYFLYAIVTRLRGAEFFPV
jgi:hypothetical protein